jgi:hypothetical protein
MGTAYGVANCGLHLKADDASAFTFSSGSLVSQWNDASGDARHATQGTVTNQPTRSGTLNGMSTVVFDGVDNFLSFTALAVPDAGFTLIAVIKANGSGDDTVVGGGSGHYQLRIDSSGRPNLLRADTADTGNATTGIRDGSYHIISLVSSTALRSFYLDRVADGTNGSASSTYTDTEFIGSKEGSTEFGEIEIAELLLFNAGLSGTDRGTVEDALYAKWFVAPAGPEVDDYGYYTTQLWTGRALTEPGDLPWIGQNLGSTTTTVTAQIADLDLSGVAVTPTVGAISFAAQVADLDLSGVQAPITANVTIVAQIATLALSGVAVTPTVGAVTITAQAADLDLQGVAGTFTLGAVSLAAQAADLVLSGVAITPTAPAGGITVTAQVADLDLAGVAGTITAGNVTIVAQVATVALSGAAGTVTTTTTVGAQVGALALTGAAGSITTGNVVVAAQVGIVVLVGVPGAVNGTASVSAQVATVALSGVPGTFTLGSVAVTAQPATLALSAAPGTMTVGAVAVAAQVALLQLLAVAGTIIAAGNGPVITGPLRTLLVAIDRTTTRSAADPARTTTLVAVDRTTSSETR